jgi:cell division protein FtsQ
MKRGRAPYRFLKGFFSLLGFCALLFLIWLIVGVYRTWIAESKTFYTRRIEVLGNELLTKDEILHLGGLTPHSSIWKRDLCQVTEGIRVNPFVETVEVERLLPDVLRIRIEEKHPVALLNLQGMFYCIDEDGLVLPSKPGKLYDLPVISGDFQGGVSVGSQAGGKRVQEGLGFLMFVFRSRPEMYSRISEVVVGKPEGLILYTSKAGVPVRVGTGGYTRKILYLEAILDKLAANKDLSRVHYIDLRFEDQVVVGMRA